MTILNELFNSTGFYNDLFSQIKTTYNILIKYKFNTVLY